MRVATISGPLMLEFESMEARDAAITRAYRANGISQEAAPRGGQVQISARQDILSSYIPSL